jgi:drug/metabolite transporter (DMT)-like permease
VSERRAVLLLALAAAMWSLGGLLIKSISLHPLAIAGFRSLIAAPVLYLACGKPKFIFTKAQWGAAICLVITVILFVASTKLTTAANSILLQYTAPLYVALASGPILKERISKWDWLSLFAVFAGMILFFVDKVSPDHMLGNVLALISGVSYAGIVVCLRLQKGKSTIESLLLGHVLTAVVGLPFLFMGAMPSRDDVVRILILGVVQLGLPYAFYAIAIPYVSALESTLITMIEPVLNPIWVVLFYGESPSQNALIGGLLVLTAIVVHSFLKRRFKAESVPV